MSTTNATSREIIQRVIAFEDPPRIGMQFDDGRMSDLANVAPSPSEGFDEQRHSTGQGTQRWLDEWGNVWERLDDFSKGEVVEGAIKEWADLDGYVPPDLGNPARYTRARQRLADTAGQYHEGWVAGFPFAVARKLRTMEQYLFDVAAEPDNVRRLNGMVRDVVLEQIERFAEIGCDGIGLAEDWGTQDRLLINPAHWRAIFKPDFKILCDAAHARGLTVLMHSCGYVADIIEDLIEVGVDILQFQQPRVYDLDLLAERYTGRVTFMCPVDIQTTLQTGDRGLIRAEAYELVEKFNRGGGFIAMCYGAVDAINANAECEQWAYEAFLEAGCNGK